MSSTMLDLSAPIEEAYRRIAPCFVHSETRARSHHQHHAHVTDSAEASEAGLSLETA